MISDALADAVADIDRYLADETYAATYEHDLYMIHRVRQLADEMDVMRAIFDMDMRAPWPANEVEYERAASTYRHLFRLAYHREAASS